MTKRRLDQELVTRQIVGTRSQAESYIKLGQVKLNGKIVLKAGTLVGEQDRVELIVHEQYVSRAGLKLASVSKALNLQFDKKVILDVGSSTGGFTDYALQHGAAKVIAVDVGTGQLHPKLRQDPRIELYEKTDIRDFIMKSIEFRVKSQGRKIVIQSPDIVLIDVSFISLREILPHISKLLTHNSLVVSMVKPQFEAGKDQINKGVIKNDKMRRDILKNFEAWVTKYFVIKDKADSEVTGMKGNRERFYLLQKNALAKSLVLHSWYVLP